MFNDLIASMDAAIQDTFAVQGILNNRHLVDVVIDHDVIRLNDFGESIRNSYEITFFKPQNYELVKGDVVEAEGKIYTLTAPVQGDSGVTIWAANATRQTA